MLDNTPPQFQVALAEREPPRAGMIKVCGQCSSRFSGDARFCPFDAEPLRATLDEAQPVDPLIGAVVDDRYEIEATLGEGGMGTVYRARHRVLDKKLALKVLRADLARDAELGLRFLREAKAAASIAHPSVVQITDFGNMPSGQPYFVMELLTGAGLSDIVRKGGPIPAARAVRLLLQMVDALATAHRAGVVHRDLKPDNILVCATPGGEVEVVKVLDFGLAKVAGQSRLTKAGLVFGTPHYMSPEQASGGAVDERTDIYSLGIVMYEMFTGRVPFEADTYMGVLTKHIYVAPTPPSVLLGGVTELGALEQVTLRCLEKKPEKRYASMRALADELARVAKFNEAGTLTVQPTELGEPRLVGLADELELPTAAELRHSLMRAGVTSPPHPGWLLPALGGVLLLVILVLGGVLLSHRRATVGSPATPSREAGALTSGPSLGPRLPPSGLRSAGVPASRRTPTPSSSYAPAPQAGAGDGSGPPSVSPASARPGPATPGPSARRIAHDPGPRHPTLPKSPTPKAKIVAGEIVDPWSE